MCSRPKLPVAVTRDPQGVVWFPAKAFARMLGASAQGNRLTFDEQNWIQLLPGTTEFITPRGSIHLRDASRSLGDEVLVSSDFFGLAEAQLMWQGDTYTITYPNPRLAAPLHSR